MKLNDQIIQSAETRDKSYKLFDGQGLYIEISSKGSKFWRIKYRFEGKEKRISLGAYPEVSIEAAREHMRLCKEQLKGGTDPSQARKDSNQSITVPPKLDSARDEATPIKPRGSNEISEHQDPNLEDTTSTQPTDPGEGAFSDDMGAFNDKEDDHPQDGSENAPEEDYAPPQGDQSETSSSDTAILQVLNELKGELETLRQENRFLKDQIREMDNLSEPYQPSGGESEVQDEVQEELPQPQEELPQFTFVKTKKRFLPTFNLSIKGYLVGFVPTIKTAITNVAGSFSSSVTLTVRFFKALVRELIDLGVWFYGVVKSFLSFTWALVFIDRLIYNLGEFITSIKPKLKQLSIIKRPSISFIAQPIRLLITKIFNLLGKGINYAYTSAIKALGVLLIGLRHAYAALKRLISGFIAYATKSKQNMAYVILLSLLPIVIYLVSQGFRSKEINQDIIPIEGEKDPITVDDIEGTGDFYIPQDTEVEPELIAPDAPKADAPKADAPKADAPKADAPKADAPKKIRKSLTKIVYPYPKEANWKDDFNYVQVDYFTYYFRPNEYKPSLSDEAKQAFKAAAVNNIYLVVEGFSDAKGSEQANLVAAKRRANEFTNQLYVLGFNKEQIIGTFYDAPKISAECVEPMCSFYRKTHVSVYVKKEFYEELKERAKLKQINQEALEKSQQAAPAPKQAAPAPKQAAPAPKQAAPAPKQAAPGDKVSTIDFGGLNNPMPNLIDGYRLTARLTYYFGLYESMPNLDDNMVKNLKQLFSKPDQKFAVEGFENLSDDPNQDIQIAQGRAVMMKDELIKLGLSEDRILGVFYNVPQESKGCVEIGCAKGRKVVINLFNK